ncbi:calcitonin gene-related peptide type 1 receptor-like isoform X2 [Centruroides vittatus]|uniref:calcitonin gene-related peptide type 1 receptor-like isoform X2 n=1 Tax=Centruroides vittatus TaxID=120091 RepID=UPI00351061D3
MFKFPVLYLLGITFGTISNSPQQMAISYTEKKFVAKQLRALRECYNTQLEQTSYNDTIIYCPTDFDGWSCWLPTPAGKTSTITCPKIIYEGDEARYATRFCQVDGTWPIDPKSRIDIIDYSSCLSNFSKVPDVELLMYVLTKLSLSDWNPYEAPMDEISLEECITEVILSDHKPLDGLYCERTYDGWGCWNDTKAGDIAYTKCPALIFPNSEERTAYKVCNEDGTWFKHPHSNKTWSNYTTCVDFEDLKFRQLINSLQMGGYAISATALIISLFLYFYFKALQCTRVIIHKNLFISFFVSSILWIIWYSTVVANHQIVEDNKISCQILHILLYYFMVTNYFWMLCEGLYLHVLLVVAFLSESKVLIWLYFLGWGFPVVLIVAYAVARSRHSENILHCWMDDSKYLWILSGPVCISLVLNFIFLVNIIRVLVIKLRALNTPESQQTKKAVRATVILIPLLGLHYLILPLRPKPGTKAEFAYEIISVFINSFQGLCVSLLFCFFNNEVIATLKKRWEQMRIMKDPSRRYSSVNYTSVTTKTTHDSPSSDQKMKSNSNKKTGNKANHLKSTDIEITCL